MSEIEKTSMENEQPTVEKVAKVTTTEEDTVTNEEVNSLPNEETDNNTTDDTAEVAETSQEENVVEEEVIKQPAAESTESLPTYKEPIQEETPKVPENYYDIDTITNEANKDDYLKTKIEPDRSKSLDEDDKSHYANLSKDELIEKILYYKEQYSILKRDSDRKIKSSHDYIERLEKAMEKRIERLRKQNQDDIDEIKKFSDQMIKNEKEKANNYVQNMKKSVDDEREILRQIENDSRSRFKKEKEEKNEALVEINRLRSIINSLHNDVEDREVKIQNLEENNLNVFVQKDKELEQALNQIESERIQSRVVFEENVLLKEKVIELSDEIKQFRNESEIRNSQINLLNEDNKRMYKKVSSLTRKNEELTSLYEIKVDESASLKNEIERLSKTFDNIRRNRRMSRLPAFSPFATQDGNSSRVSEYSTLSGGRPDRRTSMALTSDQLSDVSLSYDQSALNNKEEGKPEVDAQATSNDGIVTVNDASEGATKVETVEGASQQESEINLNLNGNTERKPSLVIDTNMTINNNGGDPVFNYQDDLDDDELLDDEDTIMGAMVKPLVFHTNDLTFIDFSQNLKQSPGRIYNTKLVKQCELEEVVQCLDLTGSYMGFFTKRKLLSGLKNNIVVIQRATMRNITSPTLQQELLPECALCSLKYHNDDSSMLWYKFSFEDEGSSSYEFICMFCRERLVTICNWYKYLNMIAKRIIKHDIETMYINCLQLKENMYHARNGLTTDDNDSNLLNVVPTNLRPDISSQRPPVPDFNDTDIEGVNMEEEIVKASMDSLSPHSNSVDSETLKNTSETAEGVVAPRTRRTARKSFCYNNTIQKKLDLTGIN